MSIIPPPPISPTSNPPAHPLPPRGRTGPSQPWLALLIVVALTTLLAAGAVYELLCGPYGVRYERPSEYSVFPGMVLLVAVPAAGVVCALVLRSWWALLAAPVFAMSGAIAGGWLMGAPWYDTFSPDGDVQGIVVMLLLLVLLVDVPAGLVVAVVVLDRRAKRARANQGAPLSLKGGTARQGAGQPLALTVVPAARRKQRVTLWQGLLLAASAALFIGLAIPLAVHPPGPLVHPVTLHQVGEPVVVDNTLRVTVTGVRTSLTADPAITLPPGTTFVLVDVAIENQTGQQQEAYVPDAFILRDAATWKIPNYGTSSSWQDAPPVVTPDNYLPPGSRAHATVEFNAVPASLHHFILELETQQGSHIFWDIAT